MDIKKGLFFLLPFILLANSHYRKHNVSFADSVIFPHPLDLVQPVWVTPNSREIEKRVFLPDSLSGMAGASILCYNWIDNKFYVGGADYPGIVVIDGNTNRKIARIFTNYPPLGCSSQSDSLRSSIGWQTTLFNPSTDRIYFAVRETILVIDGRTNQIIKKIGNNPYQVGRFLLNNRLNKIYCYLWHPESLASQGVGVQVFDASNDTLIKYLPLHDVYNFALDTIDNKLYATVFFKRDNNVAVIDCVSDSITKYISFVPPGIQPEDTFITYLTPDWSATSNKLYVPVVIYRSPIPAESSYICVVNCTNDSVVRYIGFSVSPFGTTGNAHLRWTSRHNKLYVSSSHFNSPPPNHIAVVDCFNDSIIKKIYIGDSIPADLIWDSIYNKIYAPIHGVARTFVVDGESDTIINRMDYTTGYILRNFQNGLLYMPRGIFVTLFDGRTMRIVDKIPTGIRPGHLVFNEAANKIYSLNRYPAGFTVIDGATQSIIKQIEISRPMVPYISDDSPIDACFSPTSNKIYWPLLIGYYSPGLDSFGIGIIDCRNDSLIKIKSLRTPSNLYSFVYNPNNNSIYITNDARDSLTIFDCNTDSVIKKTHFPQGLSQLWAHNPVNNKMYGESWANNSVLIINCSNDSVKYLSNRGAGPFVYNSLSNSVYFNKRRFLMNVDGATDSVIDSIYTGRVGAMKLHYNRLNNCIYYQYRDTFIVIDCALDSIVATIPLTFCSARDWIAIDSLRNRLWVVNQHCDTALVIDGITHQIVERLVITPAYDLFWNRTNDRIYTSHTGAFISVINSEVGIGEELTKTAIALSLNVSPNPCRRNIRIDFYLSVQENVSMKVFDVIGRKVSSLLNNKILASGYHNYFWNTKNVAQGVYFIHFNSGKRASVRKVVVVK